MSASAFRPAWSLVGELMGAGEARERGVVGETPNLAARLQTMAEPGSVVVSESTRRLLGRTFEPKARSGHRS
jgi:class 3 adenylate cyclase